MPLDDGVERSAILLIALGEDFASEVLKHLGPKDVQKLGHAIAGLKSVPRARVEEVLADFHQTARDSAAVHVDTDAYVRSVLTKALGDDKAANLISRILQGGDTNGIEGLKWMDAPTVADLIQATSTRRSSRPFWFTWRHDHASEILNHFTERLRNDVVLRIATLEGIQPAALRELNEAHDAHPVRLGQCQDVPRWAAFVRRGRNSQLHRYRQRNDSVVDAIREYDPDLAQKILDEMFVFENLMDIDDRSHPADPARSAVRFADPRPQGRLRADLREKIFKNMSQRAAEMLREDLESKGPVRLSEVESRAEGNPQGRPPPGRRRSDRPRRRRRRGQML